MARALSGSRPTAAAETIYRRSHDRGEFDLATRPPAVLAMLFDLVWHDLE